MEVAANSSREEGEFCSDDDDAQDFQVTKKLKSVVDDELINDAEEEDEFVDIDYMFGYVCAVSWRWAVPKVISCNSMQLQRLVSILVVSLGFTKEAVYVVPCVSPISGQFYHPCCVAKELSQDNKVPAEELERRISMGESFFTCPVHKCRVCKQRENTKDHSFQFAVCMRCPKSYHRNCLPSFIPFEDEEGKCGERRSVTRAWDGIVPNRILIYCLLLGLMEKAASSITLKDILKKYPVPSNYSYSMKDVLDKKLSLGKVEVSVEAVRTALRKLDEGCSIEDAEAVCGPQVLKQIFKWKFLQTNMNVYLAPLLNGMSYTSFGRHFTKVEKLEQVVDKLQWYTKTGDMIVDFCCGANDFSVMMKKKLEDMGKNCYYKNYDLFQATNDFNFEKDWMTVQREELPIGSRLIMGLNPPFGVKATLANQFIDKALLFNPKLLILIVPPETQRLDQKTSPYDLIWEDSHLLSGKLTM
ncbi:hypothetical protein OROMI_026898 [Orobanche minor]